MRVLIVDPNSASAGSLAAALRRVGYCVDRVEGASQARHLALSYPYSLLLIDPALPDEDGLQVCRSLRKQGLRVPILIVSDSDCPDASVRALESGADDVVARPYHEGELLARVYALLRRGQAGDGSILRFGDLELNLHRQCVTRAGRGIVFRRKEFAVLECLVRNPERVVSKATIAIHVWDAEDSADEHLIEVYISAIRRKLGLPSLIRTVTGSGYMLSVDIAEREIAARHAPE